MIILTVILNESISFLVCEMSENVESDIQFTSTEDLKKCNDYKNGWPVDRLQIYRLLVALNLNLKICTKVQYLSKCTKLHSTAAPHGEEPFLMK